MSSLTHMGKDQQCERRLLAPLLQGMLPDGPPAVPPGKTGDVEVGDTIAKYPWSFRGWDASGSPGCLVQGGENTVLRGGSWLVPLLIGLL